MSVLGWLWTNYILISSHFNLIYDLSCRGESVSKAIIKKNFFSKSQYLKCFWQEVPCRNILEVIQMKHIREFGVFLASFLITLSRIHYIAHRGKDLHPKNEKTEYC